MIFGEDRGELRRMYAEAWRKRTAGEPLSPLEAQIADVIAEHPEYHDAMGEDALSHDFSPEEGRSNPFLHMGLHLALREQVATDRPAGIAAVHGRVAARKGDAHLAEHAMIEILAETLWEAQRSGRPPDERQYLDRLRKLG